MAFLDRKSQFCTLKKSVFDFNLMNTMKTLARRNWLPLFSMIFLALNANSQDTKDMTFSKNEVTTDSVPNNPKTPKYEFGIGGGIVVYQGDLAPTVWGAYRMISPGLQASITRLFSPSFALRIGGTVGKFTADDLKSSYKEAYRDYRKYNFTTSFAELTAMAQWTPFGKANWRLNPYLLGGAGISYLQVKNDWSKSDLNYFAGENLQQRLVDDSAKNHTFVAPVLPVGVGLKYDVSEKISLKLEWINRITFSDYLDGFSKAANPDKNDRYSSVMLSLNFAFGRNKTSKTSRSSRSGNIINNYYYNYYYSSKNSKSENSMALKNGGKKTNSSSTEMPQEKESDPAIGENAAVLKDIQNKLNSLAENATKKESDQQQDFNMFSPENDKYIVYFSFDNSYLEGEAFSKLDRIAEAMKANTKLNVTLSGFTDLKGSYEYNMKLSLSRATICKDYLRSRNIDASRIKTEAFGKTKYVVKSFDVDQQWRNRRVEVYLN